MPTYELTNGTVVVQVEDMLGTDPTGGWKYQAPGEGNSGAHGAHYYFRSQTDEGSLKTAPSYGRFSFDVEIDDPGLYAIRLRAARDTNKPGDARNDIWLRVDGDTQDVMPEGTDTLTSGGDGFVKYKGAQTNWIYAHMLSTPVHGDKNPESDVVWGKGTHTVEFAPRSIGYHIDEVKIYRIGDAPGGTPDPVDPDPVDPDPVDPDPVDPTPPATAGTISVPIAATADDHETRGGNGSDDLELGINGGYSSPVGLRFTGIDLGAGTEITGAWLEFEAKSASSGAAAFGIEIEDSLSASSYSGTDKPNGRDYLAADVDWTPGGWSKGGTYRSPDISSLIEDLIGSGGIDADDAIAFRIAGEGTRTAWSFDGSGAAPRLIIATDGSDGGGSSGGGSGGGGSSGGSSGTVSASIAAKGDDFESWGGAGGGDLELGTDGGNANPIGLRFTGLDLDAGAAITDAWIEFTAKSASSGAADLGIDIEDSLSAKSYSGSDKPNGRDYLAGEVDWTPGGWSKGGVYRTPDISELIEDLIGSGGIDAEDALAFRIAGEGTRTAWSFDGTGEGPRLVIAYDDVG